MCLFHHKCAQSKTPLGFCQQRINTYAPIAISCLDVTIRGCSYFDGHSGQTLLTVVHLVEDVWKIMMDEQEGNVRYLFPWYIATFTGLFHHRTQPLDRVGNLHIIIDNNVHFYVDSNTTNLMT